MCFSASASFTAAGFLSITAVIAYSVVRKKSEYILASIPALFAIQQASEGLVWLYPENIIFPYIFLFFALAIWPLWIPLSFAVIAPPAKKKILNILFFMGCVLSIILLCSIFVNGAHARIMGNHIYYDDLYPQNLIGIVLAGIYLIVTIIPFFLMHNIYIRAMGCAVALSCIVTFIFWNLHFGSLWCFWAAVISAFVPATLFKNRLIK